MTYNIAVIVGSLRKDSYNAHLAKALVQLAPKDFTFVFPDIGALPLYNQDDDANQAPAVRQLKKTVEASQGLLFVTPEYNRSIPGGLKNALDVASRPYSENKWNGKPAAVISSSIGRIGGFGANHHLRQVMTFLNMPPVQQPEVYLSEVQDMLDEQGNLNSPEVRGLLQSVVDALVKMLEK